MEQIGYSLIDVDGTEIAHWGDTIGVCVGVPDRVDLPNGNFVHGAKSGDQFGTWKLVPRYGAYGSSTSVTFDGTRVISTRPVTQDMVIAERKRRLALGFAYDFGDARGVHQIGTTEQDMTGWDEVTMASQAAMALGLPTTPLNIVTNTGPVVVTAQEWQLILLAASQFRQPIWAASFALQAAVPIPANYANDEWWV